MGDNQNTPDDPIPIPNNLDEKGYALSGRIMFTSIILLFVFVLLMFCIHLYVRWYLCRAHHRHNHRRRHRPRPRPRTHLIFYVDSVDPATLPSRGLDASVIASLPVFIYDHKTHPENPPECAVCLAEFEDGEKGRVLPKCKHEFHIDCIDMWFHSHSTCPLCRASVEPEPEVVINVCEPDPGPSSGLEENRTGREVSSLRKPLSLVGVTVEVPPRSESFRAESGSACDSPSTQSSSSSFRSPMSRMLSFKRMLSRERRESISSSSGGGCSSSATELNVEQGGRGETR